MARAVPVRDEQEEQEAAAEQKLKPSWEPSENNLRQTPFQQQYSRRALQRYVRSLCTFYSSLTTFYAL